MFLQMAYYKIYYIQLFQYQQYRKINATVYIRFASNIIYGHNVCSLSDTDSAR